jgi:hypothetical protein
VEFDRFARSYLEPTTVSCLVLDKAFDGFQGGGQSWEKIRRIEPPTRQEDAEKKRLENPGQNPLSDPLLPLGDLAVQFFDFRGIIPPPWNPS